MTRYCRECAIALACALLMLLMMGAAIALIQMATR